MIHIGRLDTSTVREENKVWMKKLIIDNVGKAHDTGKKTTKGTRDVILAKLVRIKRSERWVGPLTLSLTCME